MIKKDTVKLLRECDAGAKMGIESIEDVLPRVSNGEVKNALDISLKTHKTLEKEIHAALDRFGDRGKDPAMIAEKMSWIKTNFKLLVDESDAAIADLMTDGCNMGIKSLRRYLNQYKAADDDSKRIAEKLIRSEIDLLESMASFL